MLPHFLGQPRAGSEMKFDSEYPEMASKEGGGWMEMGSGTARKFYSMSATNLLIFNFSN